jgi:hypothetical protein
MAGSDRGLRSTLAGAGVAGGVSVAVLLALSVADLGSPPVRAAVAVFFGVVVAQAYERTRG